MSEQERKMAEKADALTNLGDLKTGYFFKIDVAGKGDLEVLRLMKVSYYQTNYGNVFSSGYRQTIVATSLL